MNSIRTDAKTLEALGDEAYERGFKRGRALAAQEALTLVGEEARLHNSYLTFVGCQILYAWFKACGVLR